MKVAYDIFRSLNPKEISECSDVSSILLICAFEVQINSSHRDLRTPADLFIFEVPLRQQSQLLF